MPNPARKRKAAWEDMMKQSIFEATVTVMKKHGPAGVRMDRVARAAEMAIGTLYNYFKDKEALLLHVHHTLFDPYHEELLNILSRDISPADKMEAYFRLTCRYLNEQRDIITILIQGRDQGLNLKGEGDLAFDSLMKIIRILQEIIQEGITEGVFRRCQTLESAAMIFGAMEGFVELKIRGKAPERTVEEDVENCRALIMPGLLAGS